MANIDDLLTTTKNAVVAINNLSQTYKYFHGQKTAPIVTASTLVAAGSGYIVNFVVTVAGAAGTINNSATTAGAGASNVLFVTPATVGVYAVGARFTNGLVVIPGAGQSVTVTYSLD